MVEYVEIAGRVALAVVFSVSAFTKLRTRYAWAEFLKGLRDTQVIPTGATHFVALALIVSEIVIPVLVIVPVTATFGLVFSAIVVAGLTCGILVVLSRGTEASCPCFGASPLRLGLVHVVRNLLLLALALTALLVSAQPGSAVEAGGVVVAIATAVFLGIVVVSLDEMTKLYSRSIEKYPR